jgi:hypothetical protein
MKNPHAGGHGKVFSERHLHWTYGVRPASGLRQALLSAEQCSGCPPHPRSALGPTAGAPSSEGTQPPRPPPRRCFTKPQGHARLPLPPHRNPGGSGLHEAMALPSQPAPSPRPPQPRSVAHPTNPAPTRRPALHESTGGGGEREATTAKGGRREALPPPHRRPRDARGRSGPIDSRRPPWAHPERHRCRETTEEVVGVKRRILSPRAQSASIHRGHHDRPPVHESHRGGGRRERMGKRFGTRAVRTGF